MNPLLKLVIIILAVLGFFVAMAWFFMDTMERKLRQFFGANRGVKKL